MAANVDQEKCSGCEECVETCPMDAISVTDKKATVDADNCSDCGACVDSCPNGAIEVA